MLDALRGGADAVDGGLQLGGAAALALEHDPERFAALAGEAVELLVDLDGAGAGHLEAAAGQVLRLLGRERHRHEQQREPEAGDELAPGPHEHRQTVHRGLHTGPSGGVSIGLASGRS